MQNRHENTLFSPVGPSMKHIIIFGGLFAVWTAAAGIFLILNLQAMDEKILNTARIQARTSIEKDILYRRWNSMHGGVYGAVSGKLQPNPYLDLENRDVTTSDGQKLIKINPAYMTRQVHELGETESGIIGHITSLNPIRPGNKADEWEAGVLSLIEKSRVHEVSEMQMISGERYLRMLIPLVTEQACLKCHAKQGYKVGEIRGGISVNVPLEPIIYAELGNRRVFIALTVFAWLLGCLMIRSVAGIKKAELEALASESKYRTLVETVGEGILYLDRMGNIIFCNPPFAHMLGYPPDHLQGMAFQELMDDESGDEYTRRIEGITNGKLHSFELHLLKKDGSQVTVLFSPRILRGETSESTGLLAITTDISRLKRMEQEMLRQQRLSSVGMLAGGIAHEVSAPLQYLEVNSGFLRRSFNAFNSFMQDLKTHGGRGGALHDKLKEHELSKILQEIPGVLDENERSVMRISDITSSIKELAGTGPVNPVPENINNLIRQCVEITRSSWQDVAMMDLDLSSGLPDVRCIARDMNQVFIAVIMNAVDAISATIEKKKLSGKGTIRIASGRVGGEVRIVISDNGLGIVKEDLGKIFEPFFTTKKPGKGTGQGLAVAQRIMNEHNGSISAESPSGKGAVFVITLPLNK